MCLGHTHALAGLTAGAATAPLVLHLAPGQVLHHPAELVPWLAACAGAGVLPDIDHPDATLAHCFGFLTKGFAWLVGKASGGHRHGTHSVIGVAVFTVLAAAAVHWRHDLAAKLILAAMLSLIFAGALYALRIGGHHADTMAIGGAAAMTVTGAGLATVAAAVAVGCSAHIVAGDMFTDSGCPLGWPFIRYRFKWVPEPLAFTTGTKPEAVFAFVIGVALLYLSWHAVTLSGVPLHTALPHP